MSDLTADRLRSLVLYDAATGLFTWRGARRGVRAERDVPIRDNRCNAARRNDNGSGVAGVHWDAARQKWQAKISLNKRLIFLGRFSSYDAAVVARRRAERAYGYSERHGSSPA